MTLNDTVEQSTWRTLRVPDIPLGFDITDLLIYEEEKRNEQRKRDEQYRQIPLEQYAPRPMPYRKPEPPKENERGVVIVPMY